MTLPIDFELEAIDEVDAAFAWYEEQRAGLGEKFFAKTDIFIKTSFFCNLNSLSVFFYTFNMPAFVTIKLSLHHQ